MKDIRERLLEAFQIEYRDHLETIRRTLSVMEEAGTSLDQAQLDEMFRRAHTLKGAARAVNLPFVEQVSHRMETLLARLRNRTLVPSKEFAVVQGRALDVIEDWVAAQSGGGRPPDASEVLAALDDWIEGKTTNPPPAQPRALPTVEKSARVSSPAATDGAASLATDRPHVAPSQPFGDAVRVHGAHLDALMRPVNELVAELQGQQAMAGLLADMERRLGVLEGHWRGLRRGGMGLGRDGAGDRVVSPHAEALGQELRGLTSALRAARLHQRRANWSLRQLAGALQDGVRQLRMVPADSVFGGFRKMVRDLAAEAGKKVEVKVEGLDVEADRLVLQGLKDPVMHLLRNALAHGMETEAQRRASGKSVPGLIRLAFSIEGGRLVTVVEDDGRGLDLEAIRDRAAASGLMTTIEAATCGEDTLIDLIFDPGFSTSREVDTLSGRGMGMSVVRQAVATMNGNIQVKSRQPSGTVFRLGLPISVSSQRLMLVQCADQVFGIPAEGVSRLHRIAASRIVTADSGSLVELAGESVAVVSLSSLLGLGDVPVMARGALLSLLEVRHGERRLLLAVDGFLALREGVVKDIGVPAAHGTLVSGGILQDDGRVSLVLNPFELVELHRRSGPGAPVIPKEEMGLSRKPVILLAEDSLTTRTLEKAILEAHGHQVEAVRDGAEALARIRQGGIDLVVSDVQMPNLDGLGLLAALRADPDTNELPVVLVTSLDTDEDRRRGLDLGADAYVVKSRFDQAELLEVLEQLL